MRMVRLVNFQDELKRRTDEIEEMFRSFLPAEEGFARTMAQAMNYSMLAGGKRLRPMLIQETYRLFGGTEKVAEPFMAGMEMIHTHSLIHDDLPALDNDDYRRGRLTTHKVYGEAMGVLSGVALLNYAYETMLQAFSLTEDQDRVICALKVMAEKTGIHGMLGGQSVDVSHLGKYLRRSREKFRKKIAATCGDSCSEEMIDRLVDERVDDELRSGVLRIIDLEDLPLRRDFAFVHVEAEPSALVRQFIEFARADR